MTSVLTKQQQVAVKTDTDNKKSARHDVAGICEAQIDRRNTKQQMRIQPLFFSSVVALFLLVVSQQLCVAMLLAT